MRYIFLVLTGMMLGVSPAQPREVLTKYGVICDSLTQVKKVLDRLDSYHDDQSVVEQVNQEEGSAACGAFRVAHEELLGATTYETKHAFYHIRHIRVVGVEIKPKIWYWQVGLAKQFLGTLVRIKPGEDT